MTLCFLLGSSTYNGLNGSRTKSYTCSLYPFKCLETFFFFFFESTIQVRIPNRRREEINTLLPMDEEKGRYADFEHDSDGVLWPFYNPMNFLHGITTRLAKACFCASIFGVILYYLYYYFVLCRTQKQRQSREERKEQRKLILMALTTQRKTKQRGVCFNMFGWRYQRHSKSLLACKYFWCLIMQEVFLNNLQGRNAAVQLANLQY